MTTTPNKPEPEATEAGKLATPSLEKKERGYTLEELDELEPLECCPGCITHPHNR